MTFDPKTGDGYAPDQEMTEQNLAADRLRDALTSVRGWREPRTILGLLNEALATARQQGREEAMERLVDIHDCRDRDTGWPCAFHAQERRLLRDVQYEDAIAGDGGDRP